ncbi:Extra-large guanine nucleotide-binding protein 2 [Raphanus sativus]|nr:Extra-large guanine nucleotide-binding protein 2 [Raphanus sativus]
MAAIVRKTDISFADEYTGPCIANVPRANPLEVDEIPTAHPVSSVSLSSGLSHIPVVQPLVSRVTKKPPEASPSVVDVANANRVRFLVPSQGSECDESSYLSDEESVATATPRAERKGKKGSCYRCLTGNRFTEKELCIVCDAKYCSNCVRRAMGAMPEGRKCVACIGHRVSEKSNRKSLGKCSRMLKRVLTDSELQKVMHDEVTCKANQLYARLVSVNGRPLSEEELERLQTCPNPPKKLKPGELLV